MPQPIDMQTELGRIAGRDPRLEPEPDGARGVDRDLLADDDPRQAGEAPVASRQDARSRDGVELRSVPRVQGFQLALHGGCPCFDRRGCLWLQLFELLAHQLHQGGRLLKGFFFLPVEIGGF